MGETYDFDGYMVSSASGHNGPVTWEVKSKGGLLDTDLATINATTGEMTALKPGIVQVRMKNPYLDSIWFGEVTIKDAASEPLHSVNIEWIRYTRISGQDWWGLGADTDHTISVIKSKTCTDHYFIAQNNINGGVTREYIINDNLKNTLLNLEAGYQSHHNNIPAFDKTTTEENAAHSSKGETDQLS